MRRGVAATLAIGASVALGVAAARSLPATADRVEAAPTSTLAPSTAAGPTATAAGPTATGAPTTAPTATAPALPEPESEAADPVRTLVPRIAALPAVLASDEDRLEAITLALADPGTAIAVGAGPGTLCAVVPIPVPLMAEGRWERNGETIASSSGQRRDPPGYGDCLPNEDGEPFREGVYQYVAVGATGAISAAATVVVGSETVDVWLVNNGDEPVCLVQMSPEPADFYEAHATDGPLERGEAMQITVAELDQDVRVFGCPPDEVLRSLSLSPEPQAYTDLFDADPTDTTMAGTGSPPATTVAAAPGPTSAVPRPTTTTT